MLVGSIDSGSVTIHAPPSNGTTRFTRSATSSTSSGADGGFSHSSAIVSRVAAAFAPRVRVAM